MICLFWWDTSKHERFTAPIELKVACLHFGIPDREMEPINQRVLFAAVLETPEGLCT